MAELDEIRERLGALEQRVDVLEDGQAGSRRAAELFAVVDRDVADLKEAFSAQRHVLQALRDTQLEQGRALADQGRALGGIIVTLQSLQESQRAMQESQRSMQEDQRSMREDQRAMRESQRSMQEDQRSMREDQRSMREDQRAMRETLAEHGRILARLDPGEDSG